MSGGRLLLPLGLVAAMASASWSWSQLERARSAAPSASQVLYLPSGKYLKVTAMGHPEVMADLIYIWSIQYYSNYEAVDRFKYLDHIYSQVISELDPHYIDPYLIGAMIMSIESGDHEMALKLLDKGIGANPDEWILAFDAGFLCYDKLRDYPRAAGYFEKALRSTDAPNVIRRLHAEMYNKMGDKRTSLEYWTQVYDEAETDYVRDVAWRHVHDLRIEVDLESLRQAIGAYTRARGTPPLNLEALVKAGLVSKVPLDPEGSPYAYDRRTGEVRSQSRFKLRRKASA